MPRYLILSVDVTSFRSLLGSTSSLGSLPRPVARVKPGETGQVTLVKFMVPVSSGGGEEQSGVEEDKEETTGSRGSELIGNVVSKEDISSKATELNSSLQKAHEDGRTQENNGNKCYLQSSDVVIGPLESLTSVVHCQAEEDLEKLTQTSAEADSDQSKLCAAFAALKASDTSEASSTALSLSPSSLPATSAKRRFLEAANCPRKQEEQSSSVGSSLVGESVGSWLATTSDSLEQAGGQEQSEGANRLEVKDGAHSDNKNDHEMEGSQGREGQIKMQDVHSSLQQKKLPILNLSRVTFCPSLPLEFPTHSSEDYDRRNPWVDPAAASVEWEEEKRLERLRLLTVELVKGEQGLGLSIIGMGMGTGAGGERLGVYVKGITPGGQAMGDGRIVVGDQLLSVNGHSLVGVTQEHAASVLRAVTGRVEFLVGREEKPEEGEVAKLLREQVQKECGSSDEEDEEWSNLTSEESQVKLL